jgi:hypothetical protein
LDIHKPHLKNKKWQPWLIVTQLPSHLRRSHRSMN